MSIRAGLISLFCVFCIGSSALAEVSSPSAAESEFVEAFVLELDSHFTWPAARATEGNGKYLVLAAVGDTAWTAQLKTLWAKKTSTGLRTKIRVVEPALIPSNSHGVFISTDDAEFMASTLKKLSGTGTLTIALGKDLIESGAMVVFYPATTDGGPAMSFALNMVALSAEGLEVSQELRGRADRVIDKTGSQLASPGTESPKSD